MKLIDYVEPYTGSIGHLLTATKPICAQPHSMSRLQPVFREEMKDYFLSDCIFGFVSGVFTIMPENENGEYESRFDHDNETCRVDYYKVWLEDCLCEYSYSATKHGGIAVVDFDNSGAHRIKLGNVENAAVENGFATAKGVYEDAPAWGVLRADSDARLVIENNELFVESDAHRVVLKFAVSFISVESALKSFEKELEGKDFEAVKEECGNAWEELLDKIKVDGNERDKRIFYTALYRVYLRQYCISENGSYYSGFDGKVHSDNGHGFYVNDGVWDTHRGAHPLQSIIEPDVHYDILESFIRQYEQSGWLHDFPFAKGGVPCMLGSHTTTLFADALAHGFEFDIERAWKAIRFAHFEGSLLPWHIGPETEYDRCYREKGFAPAIAPDEKETLEDVHPFERRQAVAVTLEQAYDDYCAAKIARAAGADEDAGTLDKWSQNYRNVFDSSIGFMAPRNINGEFIKPYDPLVAHAQGGRDYFAECNGWVYSMEVRHDVKGLIELLGGKEAFAHRMDRIFNHPVDYTQIYHWLAVFPDSTGLIGQYCMGNEPAFHIPYMYNFCGQPWKTQKVLHDICRVWFSPHPLGICGDEDGGAMSAWYAFTAMGFYPFCPGSGYYVIGSPLFDITEMKLGNGKTFTVIAKGASEGVKYIESAMLNGKPLTRSWFTAEELMQGGTLELTMSKKPCKEWASKEEDCPPSLY